MASKEIQPLPESNPETPTEIVDAELMDDSRGYVVYHGVTEVIPIGDSHELVEYSFSVHPGRGGWTQRPFGILPEVDAPHAIPVNTSRLAELEAARELKDKK